MVAHYARLKAKHSSEGGKPDSLPISFHSVCFIYTKAFKNGSTQEWPKHKKKFVFSYTK